MDVATFTVAARGPAAAVIQIAGATSMVIVMTMPDQRNCGAGERDQRVVAARGGWVERMRVLAAGQGRFPCAAPAGECASGARRVADIDDGVAAICGMDNLDASTQLACTTRIGHFPVRDWTQDLQGVDIDQCPGAGT